MQRYVMYLRAINVGGRIVKMEYLRELLTSLKLSNVETFIASGNVIFDSPNANAKALETKIERSLAANLPFEVPAFIRTRAELTETLARMPFDDPGEALYVGFLKNTPSKESEARLVKLSTSSDGFRLSGREFWWRMTSKMSDSKITGVAIERALGMATTMRNVTTVRKMVAKYPEST